MAYNSGWQKSKLLQQFQFNLAKSNFNQTLVEVILKTYPPKKQGTIKPFGQAA